MPTVITGDIHWSANPRNAYRGAFASWLLQFVHKYEAKDLIILGDLTDEKDNHSAQLVNDIVKNLYEFSKLCFVTILTGNHDYTNVDSPFFQFTQFINSIDWINEIRNDQYDDIGNCLFLPHTNNWAKEWPEVLKKKYDCVFTHATFEGATGGFGKLRGLPLSIVKGQTVISGDVHVPQTIGNVTYVGAPYTTKFGDNYNGRVLLVDDRKTTSHEVLLPQKWQADISSIDELKSRKKYNFLKGDILKIRYALNREDYERWYDLKSEVKQWAEANGYDVEVVPVVEAQFKPKAIKRVDKRTDEQLISAYAKRVNLPSKSLDRGLYLLGKSPT